jgi:hypothetical protein
MQNGNDLLVIQVEGHRVANEILGSGFQTKFIVNKFHVVFVQINFYN